MSKNNFSEELQQNIIKFYLKPSTEIATMKMFSIGRKTLNTILLSHGVAKHSADVQGFLRKQTCLARYGVESVRQVKAFEEKRVDTLIQHYGSIENAYKLRQEKTDRIKFDKYGDSKYNNRDKYKQTCLTRFGCENPFQNACIKQKYNTATAIQKAESTRHKTFLEKYKVDCVGKLAQSHQNYTYFYDNTYFDSSWELALWIYAHDHNEDIIRLPCTIEFEYNNSIHVYLPDFEYKGQLIEIKGDQFIHDGKLTNPYRDNVALDTIKTELLAQYSIQLWSGQELRPILAYITKVYGKDYLKQFKV